MLKVLPKWTKFKVKTFISILLLIILFVTIKNHILIVYPIEKSFNIGIIDGLLSEDIINSNNITSIEKYYDTFDTTTNTHGDNLLQFIKSFAPNAKIYYYNAYTKEGNISSDSIISGLEWMKENKVDIINISLSTKICSEKLQNVISNNISEYKIYSSFNNKINSYDYPAMFENVFGVGVPNKINLNYIDYKFKSNKIFVFGKNYGL